MKKGVFAIALTAVFLASSQTNGSDAKKSQLDGTWELVSGQQLPKGARDIKIISGGHFIFVAYDTEKGKPLYTGGGTYVLNGSSYSEHIEYDKIQRQCVQRRRRRKWRMLCGLQPTDQRPDHQDTQAGSETDHQECSQQQDGASQAPGENRLF